jgi:acyl transferase domain-containing protein
MNETTQANQPPRLAFLFTGHGAQYPGMGRGLYEQSAVFRQAIEACDEALRPYLDHPLPDVLYHPDLTPRLLDSMTYAQAGLFALEYGLVRLWQSWGVWPTAVMGHSLGEYVAACVAGVFSLADAAKLVAARSRLMDSVDEMGLMAVIFAGEEAVAQAVSPLADDVAIAVINGPSNVVISGRKTAVQTIMAQLKEERIRSRSIDVAQAAHSPLLDPVLPEFEAIAATVQYHDPTLALVSTVTGQMVEPGEVTNAAYWRRHLRLPVRFADAMQTLHTAGYTHFLEIGPQPTLLGMGKRCLPADIVTADAVQWLASLDKNKDDWQALAASATELGIEVLFDEGR